MLLEEGVEQIAVLFRGQAASGFEDEFVPAHQPQGRPRGIRAQVMNRVPEPTPDAVAGHFALAFDAFGFAAFAGFPAFADVCNRFFLPASLVFASARTPRSIPAASTL